MRSHNAPGVASYIFESDGSAYTIVNGTGVKAGFLGAVTDDPEIFLVSLLRLRLFEPIGTAKQSVECCMHDISRK